MPIIYTYTRAQALEDGQQIDVTTTAAEAGIRFPVYMTRQVWSKYVEIPPGVTCQDEAGRLWDVVWMLRYAVLKSAGGDRLRFSLYVRNSNHGQKLISLRAQCGPVDMDDPRPCITIMDLDED